MFAQSKGTIKLNQYCERMQNKTKIKVLRFRSGTINLRIKNTHTQCFQWTQLRLR
jgi:hypothetical protein